MIIHLAQCFVSDVEDRRPKKRKKASLSTCVMKDRPEDRKRINDQSSIKYGISFQVSKSESVSSSLFLRHPQSEPSFHRNYLCPCLLRLQKLSMRPITSDCTE